MRARLSVVAVVSAAVASLAGCASSSTKPAATPSGLAPRTVKAGTVSVKIDPVRIDTDGAVFKIDFDTHSGSLSFDPARSARLLVGNTSWTDARWSGDGPGGHHREGRLSFSAAGPARGTARLRLRGLPGPVDVRWQIG